MGEKGFSDKATFLAGDYSGRPFDFIGEGKKTALVCEDDPSLIADMSAALEEIGYIVTRSSAVSETLKNMMLHAYDLILVREELDGKNPGDEGILEHISRLPMSIRRNVFVVLLSTSLCTMDNMAAFTRSVNLVINLENIGDAAAIIRQGISDNETFYATFKEAMKNAGRM